MRQRTAENHEALRLTPAERAADRAEWAFLLNIIWAESGCHSPQLARELEEADYIAKRLARKAK